MERERKIELTDLNEARSYYRNLIWDRMHPSWKWNRSATGFDTAISKIVIIENWVTFALNRLDRLREEAEGGVKHRNLQLNRDFNVYGLDQMGVHRGVIDRPETEIVTTVLR